MVTQQSSRVLCDATSAGVTDRDMAARGSALSSLSKAAPLSAPLSARSPPCPPLSPLP